MAAAIAPITAIRIIKPIKEITRPAMAKPRGALNTPTKEKMAPSNHKIQSSTGTQQKMKASRAITKPAVPSPLLLLLVST